MKYIPIDIYACFLMSIAIAPAHAALTMDRSRLIYNEGEKSISINVTNRNAQDPYLAQGWMEDEKEQKITEPFMVLPPVQRVDAGKKTRVRIQAMPMIAKLPKDRESVFYFNLREIPPKSTKPNTLTLAMQTRLKVFYRPGTLKVDPMADAVPGTENLTLTQTGDRYVLTNPTPYHFSFVEVRTSVKGAGLDNFEPIMVHPMDKVTLPVNTKVLGNHPVLMFINDYGSQRLLPFTCSGGSCRAMKPQLVPLNMSVGQATANKVTEKSNS